MWPGLDLGGSAQPAKPGASLGLCRCIQGIRLGVPCMGLPGEECSLGSAPYQSHQGLGRPSVIQTGWELGSRLSLDTAWQGRFCCLTAAAG